MRMWLWILSGIVLWVLMASVLALAIGRMLSGPRLPHREVLLDELLDAEE